MIAKPVDIEDAVLLIRPNQRYKHDMSVKELYEATRGIWVLGSRREQVSYAFAVFEGVVQEVYEIDKWHPAGTLEYQTRDVDLTEEDRSKRWEFEARVAPETVRAKYIGRSVAEYFAWGAQNPVKYVNC